ncbi:MAG TPA: class I SAM-dependent methyltransferase [Magnetospirillaceae bacterium]
MRNVEQWVPTRVVSGVGGWRPSSDPSRVSPASRVVAGCLIRHYQKAIEDYAAGRLLDLGCGYVPYYGIYRDRVDEAVCVDWAGTLHKSAFLDYEADLNRGLPFLDSDSFDTVLLTDVLEHIYRPAALVAETYRVLKSGGNLILGVPFLYWIHEDPYDYHRYTEFALRRLCTDAGFVVAQLTAYGGAPEVIADLGGKLLMAMHLGRLCGVYAALCRMFLNLNAMRNLSARTAGHLPLGYVLVARK